MSFYTRLMGTTEPKLEVHTLSAGLFELATGNIVRAQLETALANQGALSASEQTELTTLIGTYDPLLTLLDKMTRSREIEFVLLLAENGTPPYDSEAAVKQRLGV